VKIKIARTCRTFAVMTALCIGGATAAGAATAEHGDAGKARAVLEASSEPDLLNHLSDSLQRLARTVSPAVVQIDVTGFGPAGGEEGGVRDLERQHAIGAGIIVDSEGYVMTNAHVVQGARRIRVRRSLPSLPESGSSDDDLAGRFEVLDAKLIGMEPQADLALLKVEATRLPTLRFGLDRSPQPGQLVFAIGSPNGLWNSVTMGVISSAWRQPDQDDPMVYLQTDAPINPGNSGGPLVDVTGAVVGMNTFIMSRSGGNEGLGFAIPARVVDFIYQSLRKYGHVDHVEIGVVAQTITPAMAQGLGLAQDWGVMVADVAPDGPAAAAGMRAGDIILAVDGDPVIGLFGFTAALYQHVQDHVLGIDALRGAERLSFAVSGLRVRETIASAVADPENSHVESLGIVAVDLDDRLRALLPGVRVASGVVVLGHARGFASVETGLQVGDVIQSLNRTRIESVEGLKSAVARLVPGTPVVLRIERMGSFRFLVFELE